tara:strand:+ start:371 stop:574 length:204 start_codon:yes stop_codon:yes gene_type:complete
MNLLIRHSLLLYKEIKKIPSRKPTSKMISHFKILQVIFYFYEKIKKSGNAKRRTVQNGKMVNAIAII